MNRHNISAVLILLLILLPAGFALASNGAVFLNIPNGSRETAMGETGVSHASGAAALWWNPALLSFETSQVEFQLFRWIADGKGSFGALKARTSWGGLGASYFVHGMDGFEVRDRPGSPQSVFSVHESVFSAGTAISLLKKASAGMVLKTTCENIYGSTLCIYAIDIGTSWKYSDNLALGLNLANVELGDHSQESLPETIRGGLSGTYHFTDFDLLASLEGSSIKNEKEHLHVGIEAAWQKTLFFRTGFMTGYDSHNYSMGLGIALRSYSADFSVTPYTNSLGTVWRIGFGMEI